MELPVSTYSRTTPWVTGKTVQPISRSNIWFALGLANGAYVPANASGRKPDGVRNSDNWRATPVHLRDNRLQRMLEGCFERLAGASLGLAQGDFDFHQALLNQVEVRE